MLLFITDLLERFGDGEGSSFTAICKRCGRTGRSNDRIRVQAIGRQLEFRRNGERRKWALRRWNVRLERSTFDGHLHRQKWWRYLRDGCGREMDSNLRWNLLRGPNE